MKGPTRKGNDDFQLNLVRFAKVQHNNNVLEMDGVCVCIQTRTFI